MRHSILNNVTDEHIELFSEMNIKRQHSVEHLSLYENSFKNYFVHEVSKKLNIDGTIEVGILSHNDHVISYAYGFYYRNIYYYWNVGFLPEFSKYSPGKILLYFMLSEAFKNGYEEFDFMRGAEQYKFIWTSEYRNNQTSKFKGR